MPSADTRQTYGHFAECRVSTRQSCCAGKNFPSFAECLHSANLGKKNFSFFHIPSMQYHIYSTQIHTISHISHIYHIPSIQFNTNPSTSSSVTNPSIHHKYIHTNPSLVQHKSNITLTEANPSLVQHNHHKSKSEMRGTYCVPWSPWPPECEELPDGHEGHPCCGGPPWNVHPGGGRWPPVHPEYPCCVDGGTPPGHVYCGVGPTVPTGHPCCGEGPPGGVGFEPADCACTKEKRSH